MNTSTARFRKHADRSVANKTAARMPFLSNIRIDHGPVDLLARFFIAADAALAADGIDLHFGTFDELEHANEGNRDNWRPLNPSFVPANGLVDQASSFVLLGIDPSGQVVTATAMKVFDWAQTNLKIEAESLRLLYSDPLRLAPPGAACVVAAPSAPTITGKVGYAGAGWLHPSVRGRRLGAILSRVLRAWAFARWRVDVVCAISSLGLIGKGYTDQNGYRHMEPGISFSMLEACPPEAGLVWITADETIDDLRSFVAALPGKFGRAQNAPLSGDIERQDEAGITKSRSTA